MSSDSNGTSFSSKALLSIADLEGKEKLYVLFIMWWEEVRKNRLAAELHNVLMGAGASEGLTVEVGFDFSV